MSETRLCCTFTVADQWFGLDVTHVQELIRGHRVTRVPMAPAVIRGLMNLRGQIVTVVDLRLRLGVPDRALDEDAMNVVVSSQCGPASLLVDSIGDVIELESALEESPPDTIPSPVRDLLAGVYQRDDHLLLMLDLDRVLAVVVDLADDEPVFANAS